MKLQPQKITLHESNGKLFEIKFFEPSNREAVLTHYLHSIQNGNASLFKKDALNVIKKYVEYRKEEDNVNLVAETALQQFLFEIQNVPFPAPEN